MAGVDAVLDLHRTLVCQRFAGNEHDPSVLHGKAPVVRNKGDLFPVVDRVHRDVEGER